MKKTIKIEMLGGFSIYYNNKLVEEHMRTSAKSWKLLQYLIVHRYRTVSREELIEHFCAQNQPEDPASALHKMVYRVRTALSKGGLPCAGSVIISSRGGYSWNNEIKCSVDIEDFEDLIKKADVLKDYKEEKLNLLLKAISLYKGDFLPNSDDEFWVKSLSHRLRNLYLKSVHSAVEILISMERNEEVESICANALQIDPFNEETFSYYICGLLACGKKVEALESYKRMESLFFDALGESLSDKIRALYDQIQRPAAKEGFPLESVINEWLTEADYPGAYYCDFGVFKTICQIESHQMKRNEKSVYIARINTKHSTESKADGIMMHLGMRIPERLRKGDLFTRSGPGEYMIMLSHLNYEECKTLVTRIMSALDSKYLPDIIGTSIKKVSPM